MNYENLKLQNQIEQLEKRVSNIRTTDVSQIYQTIQTSNQDIQNLNNSFTNLSTSLNTVADSLEELSSNISYNDLLTLNLSRNVADDFNTSSQTEYFYTTVQEKYASTAYLIPWHFVVGLGQVVSGKITLRGMHFADTIVYGKLLLNDKTNSWAIGCTNNGGAITFEFNFSFVPKQKNNKFTFSFEEMQDLTLLDIKIEFFSGNNPIMLNYSNQNQIAMFGNTLYVYRGLRTSTETLYMDKMQNIAITNQDDIDFTTSTLMDGICNERIAMLNETDWIMHNKSSFNKNSIGINLSGVYSTYSLAVNDAVGISLMSSATPYTCQTITNSTTKFKYIILAVNYVAEKGLTLFATKGKAANAITLKYNNQDLPNVFVDIQAVLPMGATELGDGQTFYGYVAVREDGECIYFPDFNSTYYIKLGFGRNPFCFLDGDKISITLGGKNFCKRVILAKNTSGVWAVEEQYFYKGIDHIYPINNAHFVFVRKNGNVILDKKEKYYFKKDIQVIQYTDVSTTTA